MTREQRQYWRRHRLTLINTLNACKASAARYPEVQRRVEHLTKTIAVIEVSLDCGWPESVLIAGLEEIHQVEF